MATTEELIKQTDELNEAKKYQEVIDLLTDEVLEERQSAELHTERARAHSGLSEQEKQWQDCHKAIVLNPNYFKAYSSRGKYWLGKNEYNRALEDFDQAIQLNPDYATAFSNRGHVWYDKGEYDRAIEDVTRAIEIKPDEAIFFLNRGLAWSKKGEHDKAITDFDLAIHLNPNDATFFNERGIVWDKKGQHNKAIEDFDYAIELNPQYAVAFSNRGNAWGQKGEYDKAITDYNQAIHLKPDYADAFINRGNAWNQKGDYDKAITDFECANRINSLVSSAYFGLGTAYFKKNIYNLSESHYKRSYYLNFDTKQLIDTFSKQFPNPLILHEVLLKITNLKTFLLYQLEISFCEDVCKKWLLFLDYSEINKPKISHTIVFFRFQAYFNYYMGHTQKTYAIISQLTDISYSLRDYYYFILAANSFLEPVNEILIRAQKQIDELPEKSTEEWYYSGQIYTLAQEYEKAEHSFLQISEFIPAKYALFGLYRKQERSEEANELAQNIGDINDEYPEFSFLNGIQSIHVSEGMTFEYFEESFYNRLYYYELFDEINQVANIQDAMLYDHREFYDLLEFAANLKDHIESENERRNNEAFFNEIMNWYIQQHKEEYRANIEYQCSVNPQIQDINTAVENAVKEYDSSFEQQIAIRIDKMAESSIVYLVVIKHFYYLKKINAEEAVLLHFFVLKKAIETNDKTLVTGVNTEFTKWLPVLSDIFKSPIIVKVLMKAWKRIQDGNEVYKMDYFKNYSTFKENFIMVYLPWWRDTIIKNELEKHQFSRKTDMNE